MTNLAVIEYERARDTFITAARSAALLRSAEMALENGRHLVKLAAIKRLLLLQDPITERAYTATSAEKYVESDSLYLEHLTAQRDALVTRMGAEAERDAARCNMHVASALICGGPR